MSYKDALTLLRQNVFDQPIATPEVKPKSTFIPIRTAPLKDAPVAKDEHWLSGIKRRSAELKQKAASEPKPGNFASGLAAGLEASVKKKQEVVAEPKSDTKGLIERRRGDLPSYGYPSASKIPVDAEMPQVLDALASIESRGSGDYKALGPVVEKGTYKGQRAIGRYQVMEGNIPSWTKAALGRSMTPEEFLHDNEAQDLVASYQLQKAKDKYGTWEDAASVWFSGRPISVAGDASDGYTTVPEYINKFRRYFKAN